MEHDPLQIWELTLACIGEALDKLPEAAGRLAGIGITNQRETVVVWERRTGRPIHNAIVWQCRRTADQCAALQAAGHESWVQERTGLVLDAYFSGTKFAWILDQTPGARERAERGELLCGTIDSWLIWNLTAGAVHVTDVSNASRTLLFNIHTLDWDAELLELFQVPQQSLPRSVPSSAELARTAQVGPLPAGIPIAGVAGDQQAALFGQACYNPGMVKNTYGTGCFVLMTTGPTPITSQAGLLSTVAWQVGDQTTYALEGSVFVAGAAIQWLRDGLGIIAHAAETEDLASSVPDTGGVYFVPAFAGLGAPHWDMYARGTIVGITGGTTRGHLTRAALEAMAYQSRDVIDTMAAESGVAAVELRVDGGATANNFLMQFQADLLGMPVKRPRVLETTALGAAYLAGIAVGIWSGVAEVQERWHLDRSFTPALQEQERAALYQGWSRAVERARNWVQPDQVGHQS